MPLTGKQIDLKERFKFRLIRDETSSYGVLGRSGRGLTEHQNVDPSHVDTIIGSLSGALCASGGFSAGSHDIVEHQRISSSAYTYSAALPAMMATAASESLLILQDSPELLVQLRENIKALRAQLDPRSEFIKCLSCPDNPIQLLVLKGEVVLSRNLSSEDQTACLQDAMDEVSTPASCLYLDSLTLFSN